MNQVCSQDRYFKLAWIIEASDGHCDELGSAEFRRLQALWHQLGHPTPIVPWIRDHANRPPASADNGQA